MLRSHVNTDMVAKLWQLIFLAIAIACSLIFTYLQGNTGRKFVVAYAVSWAVFVALVGVF